MTAADHFSKPLVLWMVLADWVPGQQAPHVVPSQLRTRFA